MFLIILNLICAVLNIMCSIFYYMQDKIILGTIWLITGIACLVTMYFNIQIYKMTR